MQHRADYNFIVKYGEISGDGVAVYDLNSRRFVYMNRFLKQIFEGADQSIRDDASAIMKLVYPEDMPYVDSRYRELLSIGCIPATEFRISLGGQIKHISAEVLWLEESYTFAIFARDTTASNEHDDYVVKFTAQKDTLLDMLIHNLSGPLFMSRDVINMLSGSAAADKAQDAQKLLGIIRDSTEHCVDIINDFLKEEHEVSTEVSVKNSRFDVLEKLDVVLRMLREMNPGKTFTVHSHMENRNLTADPIKFLQVAHNVLSNAVKFTKEDGVINIVITEEKHAVTIAISDNGVGIPPALLPQLTKQRVLGTPGLCGEKSTGLGLLLISKLVEMMHGSIKIESAENEGTTVAFSFPRE